jgi:hypothetical protein
MGRKKRAVSSEQAEAKTNLDPGSKTARMTEEENACGVGHRR